MKFYELSPVEYGDDMEDERRNPVRWRSRYRIPSVKCDVCTTWATTKRLRIALPPADTMEPFAEFRHLTPDDWTEQSRAWASTLGVAAEVLAPGMEIGPPHGVSIGLISEDVVHPFPGRVWVQDRIARELETAGFTGLQLAEVQVERGTEHPVPRLLEVITIGNANVIATHVQGGEPPCPICSRIRSGWSGHYYVDEATWDGSDFFKLEDNLAIPLVTERVRELLERIGTTNLAFKEIEGRRAEDDGST